MDLGLYLYNNIYIGVGCLKQVIITFSWICNCAQYCTLLLIHCCYLFCSCWSPFATWRRGIFYPNAPTSTVYLGHRLQEPFAVWRQPSTKTFITSVFRPMTEISCRRSGNSTNWLDSLVCLERSMGP